MEGIEPRTPPMSRLVVEARSAGRRYATEIAGAVDGDTLVVLMRDIAHAPGMCTNDDVADVRAKTPARTPVVMRS
jgi:hypothetical protein